MLIAITMLGLLRNGIVAVHAISGVVMIVRDTDFLRREKQIEKKLAPGLKVDELGQAIATGCFIG